MELFTKIRDLTGRWHHGTHQNNDGNQGNTLEGLLGVPENNLQIPDLGIFELKTQKAETGSMVTLLHKEPYPSAVVPRLISALGWRHKDAGGKYPATEKSFRSTTFSNYTTVRGFKITREVDKLVMQIYPEEVNRGYRDATEAHTNIGEWLDDISLRDPSYRDVLPVHYLKSELIIKIKDKIENTVFVLFKRKKDQVTGEELFKIESAFLLTGFVEQKFDELFDAGSIAIDFDARTGHNHGTKIRIKRASLPLLFSNSETIV